MRILNGNINHKIHFSELGEITISRALHGLAGAMVGIFVPIYLYNLGFSFTAILIYFSLYFLSKTIFHFFSAKLAARIGPKHSLIIAYYLNLLYFIGLFMLDTYTSFWLLLPLGFFVGVYASLLLISTHLDLSSAVSKKLGKDLASFHIVIALTVSMGPLVGGLIAENYGADMIYLFALIIIAFAMLPLYVTGEPFERVEINYKKLNIRRFIAQAPHQAEFHVGSVIYSSLWPFYMALFIFADNPYAAVGFVTTVSLLGMAALDYLVGKSLDKDNLIPLVRVTSFSNALFNFMRAFILHPVYVIFFNLFSELSKEANYLSYTDEFYVALNHKDKIEHLIAIEIVADFSKLIFFSLLALISIFLTIQITLIISFFISGIAYSLLSITAGRARSLA